MSKKPVLVGVSVRHGFESMLAKWVQPYMSKLFGNYTLSFVNALYGVRGNAPVDAYNLNQLIEYDFMYKLIVGS